MLDLAIVKMANEDKPKDQAQVVSSFKPVTESEEKPNKVESGKLGDGGPKDAEGKANFREETKQAPQTNATAGGPDAGQTPVNEPGMSHQ